MADVVAIAAIVSAALKLLEWAIPALAAVVKAVLALIAQVRDQGASSGSAMSVADSARVLSRALDAAREHLPHVQGLDFGTGNPEAEKMLKLLEVGKTVEARLRSGGDPINTTIGVTAAQMAFAEARAADPAFGK